MNLSSAFTSDAGGERRWFPVCASLSTLAYLLILITPFMNKPVHIDDANFLVLAEGAAQDFWRPHLIPINWMGTTQRAFDVLSNPPGIAWYLLPVRGNSELLMHLWMQLWLIPVFWGAYQLGLSVMHTRPWALFYSFYLVTCPVVVLSCHSLLPDLPMLACTVAGLGGFQRSQRFRWGWAFVLGCALWFRYSGIFLLPVIFVAGWQRDRWRGIASAIPAIVPLLLLLVHDWLAYGQIHALCMVGFQNDPQHKSAANVFHNVVAGIAMLGGAGVLPICGRMPNAILGALAGALLGVNAAFISGQSPSDWGATIVFVAAGCATLSFLCEAKGHYSVLKIWCCLGIVVFVISRFAATRYWVPFVPAFALLATTQCRSIQMAALAILVNVLLSLGMAIDDQQFAIAEKQAAVAVSHLGKGSFSGHWGWQYYLERTGWHPIERNGTTDRLHAIPEAADPQFPDPSIQLIETQTLTFPDNWVGPRVHSNASHAAYHGGGRGAYAPWTLSDDPYETIHLYRRMDATAPPTPSNSTP